MCVELWIPVSNSHPNDVAFCVSMHVPAAYTPNFDAWAKADGSITLSDFHSGGTVCSPTRASVLTGRVAFRDCVDGVYDCSDPTECTPDFEFAPNRTFTAPMAAGLAGEYESFFQGYACSLQV